MFRNERVFWELKTAVFVLLSITFLNAYERNPDTLYEDSLCEYTWNRDINDCPDVLECIYPGDWRDKIIEVPANVTRISRDGFKLCLENVEIKGEADIIYIMDLSYSMSVNCTPEKNPNCNNVPYPGDPYGKRDDALEAGFNYQVNTSPQSKAGYIGFAGSVISNHVLSPVTVSTGQAQLNEMVNRLEKFIEDDEAHGGTNYRAALDQALVWLDDPTICPHNNKAVIFVSDGRPISGKQTSDQVNFLKNNNIPVYGIFLGEAMEDDLLDLSLETGGTAYLVPSDSNTDTLETVVENILKTLIKEYEPKSLQITNTTENVTAEGLTYAKLGDTAWAVGLNRFIPLLEDMNEIHVVSKFGVQDGSVPDTTLSFTFNIDVDGPYRSDCYWCRYKTTVDVLYNNTPVDTLTWQHSEYTIQLAYFGLDSLKEVDVIVYTQKGDSETIHIENPTFTGEGYIFEKTVPFEVHTNTVTKENGTTEAGYDDLLTVYWKHPYDTRDTATDTVVVSAPPNKISIYDKPGNPSSLIPYKTAPETDTITAGQITQLYAKVFSNVKWLSIYETDPEYSKQITWEWANAQTGTIDSSLGIMADDSGAYNSFFPIKAYHTIDITASLDIGIGTGPITETIRFYIKPGDAYQLVIEATNDINKTPDLNNPVPWDTIIMPLNTTTISAYAILRDSLGNWVSPATSELWDALDKNIVAVDTAGTSAGEGIIQKGIDSSGQTIIYAWQGGMKDTSTVQTLDYYITDIKIVHVDSVGDTTDIDSLFMDTNEDTTLIVVGQRNDFPDTWVLIDAKWGIDPLSTENNPPTASKFWTFSPARPDTGVIYASFTSNSITHTDTVKYIFIVGRPVKIAFDLITPDSLLIAGEIIKGVISIYNKDGLVPGLWKYPSDFGSKAQYWDILDTGEINYIPYVTTKIGNTKEDSDQFQTIANKANVTQSFYDGIDTVEFVLFYAPYHEPFHQLHVKLDNLSDPTDPFILKPGPINYIELTPDDSIIQLDVADPSKIISAKGFDQYGNWLKYEPLGWSNDTTLIDFTFNAQYHQVLIDPSQATKSQQGNIYCTAKNDTTVSNKAYLIINGPKPYVLSAKTADENGNGYLDAIILDFNKAFTIPADFNKNPHNLSRIKVVKDKFNLSDTIAVDSFTVIAFSENKKYKLHLNEERAKYVNEPQSAWTPLLTLNTLDSIAKLNNYKCQDGAPPVVWEVIKTVEDIYDNTKDRVTIILSENFYNINSAPFLNSGPRPELVFHVWTQSTLTGDTVLVDSMFYGIKGFTEQSDDLTRFYMTNDRDLNSNHFVNLIFNSNYVADKYINTPIPENQKVRVKVSGQIGSFTVGPVPVNPTIKNYFKYNKIENGLTDIPINQLFNIVKTEGGTIISFDIKGKNAIRCRIDMYVYDAIGNPTFYQYSSDIFQYIKDNNPEKWNLLKAGLKVPINFYWSGVCSNKRKADPGIYKIIIYRRIEYLDVNNNKQTSEFYKMDKTVAVGRSK